MRRLIEADVLMERSGWYNLANGKSIHGVEDWEIASMPTVCTVEEIEQLKRERDAAIADIEKLMSEVGLQCWEACEFCGMYDDDECIRNQPKGKCKAKWCGVSSENNVN